MNAPALTAEYRKVITAKFLDKPCYTCGAKLVEGDYAATNTFSQWYSYCSRCAASFKNQVAALLNRVETAVTPLGTNVPANITAEVDKVSKYVESVLNGSTDVVTAQSAKSGLFIVLGLVEKAAATPDPLIDALTAIAATNDRDCQLRSLAAPGPCQVRQPHQQPAQRCRAHAHRAWPQGCHYSRSRSGPAAAGGRGRSVPL